MKKNTDLSKSNKTAVAVIVVLTMIAVGFYWGFPFMRFILSTSPSGGIKGVMCTLKGYEWSGFPPGPTGCYKKYPDGGKTCVSGSDCVAGSCIVSGIILNKETKQMNNLTGTCPRFGPDSRGYFLMCGNAKIENGVVVEDMRGCIY